MNNNSAQDEKEAVIRHNLYDDINQIAEQFRSIKNSTFEYYSTVVDDIVTDKITSEREIEYVMDHLIDYGDDSRFIELYRRLCRHVYYHYPELVGDYVSLFKAIWMTTEDEENK